MRVISGTARGLRLLSPEGLDTRPTSDRVKEAMFSIIQNKIQGGTVLDLFSGSGALGIEALSRGAEHADFVDISGKACKVINGNAAKAKLTDRAAVHNAHWNEYLKKCEKVYDIIFLDPPYNNQFCGKAMEAIYEKQLLGAGGIIICEAACDEEVPSPYTLLKQYNYSGTKLLTFE